MAEGKRLTGLGPAGTPYVDPAGAPCFHLVLPPWPAIVTGKVGAELVIPRDRCIVVYGHGSVITPAGAKALGHRLASRRPLVLVDVEPMAARLLRAAIGDVLSWLASDAA